MSLEQRIAGIIDQLPLVAPLGLAARLRLFKDELLRANAKINLISRRASESVFDDLLVDSLAMLTVVHYPPAAKLLDIGSGAGFPWIPHKLLHEDLQIISVDANRRKIEFQRSVARLLRFRRCTFHAGRIESLPAQEAEAAIAKGVGNATRLLEWAGPHLNAGSELFLPGSLNAEAPLSNQAAGAGFEFVAERRYGSDRPGKLSKVLVFKKL